MTMNDKDEIQKAKQGIRKGLKAIILLSFPFIFAILVWGFWLNPETYWQKVVSLIMGLFTIVITFYVEMEIFAEMEVIA